MFNPTATGSLVLTEKTEESSAKLDSVPAAEAKQFAITVVRIFWRVAAVSSITGAGFLYYWHFQEELRFQTLESFLSMFGAIFLTLLFLLAILRLRKRLI